MGFHASAAQWGHSALPLPTMGVVAGTVPQWRPPSVQAWGRAGDSGGKGDRKGREWGEGEGLGVSSRRRTLCPLMEMSP